MEEQIGKSFWCRAGRLWCSFMHAAPMWPSRGYYRCSICLRIFPVLWLLNKGSSVEQRSAPPKAIQ